jgi:hypothetical protein
MNEHIKISYNNGQAVVEMGYRTVLVNRRDTNDREQICPLEWLSVALGS